jgi:hypothetical protein
MSALPFKVKAVYEYTSPHEDDLHFPAGQIITVVEVEDHEWYVGEYVDDSGGKQEGLFPKNFVEKYEPTAPPRPTRASRPKKEAEPPIESAPITEPDPEPEPEAAEEHVAPVVNEQPPPASLSKASENPTPPAPKTAPSAPSATKTSVSPPPVSEKPSGNSFRDRIAAFNKAAPPPAPFKPGGLGSGGSSNFIKKPFVAPPPSKNAYVPPPREQPPPKIYRRDEDPEIAAKESEHLEQAEKAGLAPSSNDADADAEDQPKPTSLKERIALLQKQQMEQAARHADAAQKKEKPRRPAKKRMESHETAEGIHEDDGAYIEKRDFEEPTGKHSMDSAREEPAAPRRRKSSKGAITSPVPEPRRSFGDGNEADMSGAGETTEEPEDISAGKDGIDEKPKSSAPPPLARAPTAPVREPDVGEEEGATEEPIEPQDEEEDEDEEEEDEDEDDIDPEVRQKEELRARMAKMSGGMGMHGMFGPPGGIPMHVPAPPKKKKSTPSAERPSGEYGADDVVHPIARAPPVPMIPLPGLSRVRSPEETNKRLGDDDQDNEHTPISSVRPAEDVPGDEEVVQEREAPPLGKLHDTCRKSRANDKLQFQLVMVVPHPSQAEDLPPLLYQKKVSYSHVFNELYLLLQHGLPHLLLL